MIRASLFPSLLLFGSLALGEVENDIPWGVEVVTGVRTGYIYRGFDLADGLIDLQLQGEVALGDCVLLNVGGWVGSELGDDFSQADVFLDLQLEVSKNFALGTTATYRDFDHALMDDGVDLGVYATYYAKHDFDFTLGAYHDFGNEAWYANAELGWSHRLGLDSFLTLVGGLSWVDDYLGRSGLNDFYGRASFTYNVNSVVSLTPFVGWSLLLDSNDSGGDEAFGGLLFEVVF